MTSIPAPRNLGRHCQEKLVDLLSRNELAKYGRSAFMQEQLYAELLFEK